MDERRDDWRHGVDENLASLNAGQRIWEHEQKALRKALAAMDALLRGDAGKETDGLIARLHTLETAINMLRAVIDVDKAGNKGLVGRVEAIEGGERGAERHLKLWIAIVGLLSAALVAVFSNIDRIEAFLHHKPAPVERAIENARGPKVRYRHYTIRVKPPETEAPDPDGE